MSNSGLRFLKKKNKISISEIKKKKVDKISVDFVFEFAIDLKEVFDLIEQEVNNNYFLKKEELIVKINQNASSLIEHIFEKYKNTFDLQIQKKLDKYNLKLANSSNEIILIPEDLFKINDFVEFKDNFGILLVLMKNNKFNWNYFIVRFTQLLSYSNEKISIININTMEKIRFFMNFVNFFPDFITETELPSETKNRLYKPLYSRWGRSKTFHSVYNRFLAKDPQFFKKHLWINPIPNYPYWNLRMLMCSEDNISKFPFQEKAPIYPIQVIENMNGIFNSILFLMSENIVKKKPSLYNDFLVETFSVMNNFNVFPKIIVKKKSLKIELPSIFESYTEFIDKYNENKEKTLSEYKTFYFSMNFKKNTILILK